MEAFTAGCIGFFWGAVFVEIIEKLKLVQIGVINIISKRNRLEELFMDLTKEEIIA